MSKLICYCMNVSEESIMGAIHNGAKSLQDIQQQTAACTGNECKALNPTGKCCSTDIKKLLNSSESVEGCSCCCG